jgi:hypothetical protein
MQQSEAGLLADESFNRVRYHRCEAACPETAALAACACIELHKMRLVFHNTTV